MRPFIDYTECESRNAYRERAVRHLEVNRLEVLILPKKLHAKRITRLEPATFRHSPTQVLPKSQAYGFCKFNRHSFPPSFHAESKSPPGLLGKSETTRCKSPPCASGCSSVPSTP